MRKNPRLVTQVPITTLPGGTGASANQRRASSPVKHNNSVKQAIGPLLAALIAATGIIPAQPIPPRPTFNEFEVATIKPTAPDWSGGRFIRMQSAHQFIAKNHALKTLIAAAYNLSPHAISGGPAWLDSDRYDILAKTPGEIRSNLDEQMSMLRQLLADRFKLTFHREQKQLPVYALTIAKSGPKLKETALSPDAFPEGPPPLIFVVSPQLVRLPGRYATMADLASVMQRAALDHPVIDQTGLSGRYDFNLEWIPDETQFGGALGHPPATDSTAKPDLFAALQQQLGLRLEAAKGPVETLVISQAERPSPN
jgi:uncharacterized protein (TIGR03435 family)